MLLALVIGVCFGGVAVIVLLDNPNLTWVAPAAASVAIPLVILWRVGKSLGGVRQPSAEQVRQRLDANGGALARVDSVRRTGTTVNDRHLCELTLTVDPPGEDAYATSTRMLIDPIELATFQPGRVLTVARIKPGHPDVWIVRQPDAAWQNKMSTDGPYIPAAEHVRHQPSDPATAVAGLGGRQLISSGPKGRGLRIAAYLVLAIAGAAIIVVPNASEFQAVVEYGDAADDFVFGPRQTEAVDALVAEVGSTEFVSLTFHDGFVTADAVSAPGAVTIDSFMFRWGSADRTGPATIQPEDPAEAIFDVTVLDASIIPALAEQARQLTGVAEPTSYLVIVDRDATFGSSELSIQISLNDDYYSGHVIFDAVGDVISMWGDVPGSPAAGE
ncbi:hypothetical protein FB566_4670 [Stackebrandtia endophytica]|uniref:Uncharacterized protein n=2 Tax=Stackebrandtia endophytica TaxID=1496996 RepID=A0A543B2K6_9ACTN|nr:hypothetical protein FB566_4670 [Stackebrandtia endophytica]